MIFQSLNLDRNLNEKEETPLQEGAVSLSLNEKEEDQRFRESGQIMTGTVITDCFIQTSGGADRVEVAGNDVTFYDNTSSQNGVAQGDTSRIVFTRASNDAGSYILEKRSSVEDNNDNVLSLYATPLDAGNYNYIFIGRDGRADTERGVGTIVNSVDIKLDQDPFLANGIYTVEVSTDNAPAPFSSFVTGDSRIIFEGSGITGVSSVVSGHGGGLSGIAYENNVALYMLNGATVTLGADMIPDANNAYDIGSPSAKIGTFFGSVSACPLPTIPNALEILEKIPEPTLVDDRGHYGHDRIYFDDLTFPEEILYTDKRGRVDIEHNHMLGFLLKAVIELNDKVAELEGR